MAADSRHGWTDHIIVCGLEGVGLRTVEQIHSTGIDVVVIDDEPDDRLLQTVNELGVPRVHGSARLAGTLHEAGIERARAILCMQGRDLHVLETALLARELAPHVRIVTRLANPAIAKALVTVTGPGGVLDFAELVAPAIVESCLGRSSHEFELAETWFATYTTNVEESGSLRHLYGDLAPVAVVKPREGTDNEVIVCPGRDQHVDPGDRVTILGTPDELERVGLWNEGEHQLRDKEARRILRQLRLIRRAIFHSVAGAGRALHIAVLGLVLVTFASTAVLMSYYVTTNGGRMSFVNALYFTAETESTVGFGDFSFAKQGIGLEIFGIFLIVAGATFVTTLFALLTNLLVSRRIAEALGRYRVPGMHGHVIVVGLGALGLRVVEQLLDEGHEVVVIERDESNRHLDRARGLGIPVVAADATEPAVLRDVNLSRARGVAVLTSDDLTNIEIGLAVRQELDDRFDEVPISIRLFDYVLARTVSKNFGFRNVRSTSDLAAPWFVGAALGLAVSATFSVEHQAFFVGKLTISPGGGLEGLAMADLSARTRVVALLRADGTLEHPPRRRTAFAAGDEAYLIGPSEALITVLRRDEAASITAGEADQH